MRKIRLDVETLSVETFETAAAAEERGTVLARADTVKTCDTGSYIDNCPSALGCSYALPCETYGDTCKFPCR